eukprot:TRINITY_DN2613_c0_g1_i2.p1 TRINITY_DN2613_c0_g1~~TRINITY_DN2613_c0_g1_i2.p1  ORF type:complete len:182 (+),score=5.79 TRINITY_DN2613_c0_g1_i2:1445-1990(+)
MWIDLHKIDCKSTNLFKKKYLLLTKDQLSMFINWILELRDQFSCVGIEALKDVYNTSIRKICSSIQISSELSPLADNTALPPVDEDFEDEDSIKCNNAITSDTASFASLSDQSDELLKVPELNGEFLLEIDEWDKIHFIDLHGRERLNRDWTTVFSENISKLYPACVLKFNNYWFKKSFSR